MTKKVRKVFGENPEIVNVLSTQVAFDENGDAEVEDDIAEVLEQIPGYTVKDGNKEQSSEEHDVVQDDITSIEEPSEDTDEDEDETEEPAKIVKPARPARKAPNKK
jgi:hypothetical protein